MGAFVYFLLFFAGYTNPEVWLLSGWFWILVITVHVYGLLKYVLLRVAGYTVDHVYLGLPICLLADFTFLGTRCSYSAIPIFPVLAFHKRRSGYSARPRSRAARSALSILTLASVNLITPALIVSAIYMWMFSSWALPEDYRNAKVTEVLSGSVAERLGLRAGDLIISALGQRLTRAKDFQNVLMGAGGTSGYLLVCRDRRYIDPIPIDVPRQPSLVSAFFGIKLEDSKPDSFVVVQEIEDDSLAERMGFRSGDILTGIDGIPVKTFADVVSAADEYRGTQQSFSIIRGGRAIEPLIVQRRDFNRPNAVLGLWLVSLPFSGLAPLNVTRVQSDSEAESRGIKKGDSLLEFNRDVLTSRSSLLRECAANVGRESTLTIARGAKKLSVSVTPRVLEKGGAPRLGVDISYWQPRRMTMLKALEKSARIGIYSLTIPGRLLVQIAEGLVNPHGCYNVWSRLFDATQNRSTIARPLPQTEAIEGGNPSIFDYVGPVFGFLLLCKDFVMPFMIVCEVIFVLSVILSILKNLAQRSLASLVFLALLWLSGYSESTAQRNWNFEISAYSDLVPRESMWRL